MDADERLTALKKAYADIILNTAKEAAARIMVSERKALRFQQELFLAKEEALQMMLRLKHMMDFKMGEAATASLSQHKKIEELEAQLQEAEDIVNELRQELRDVQFELERAINNKEQSIATPSDIADEKRSTTSQSITENGHESNSKPDEDNKCYNESYIGKLELPSIILRSKETEPYRNGCTQRICAFERNKTQEDERICTPSTHDGKVNDKINVEKSEEARLTSWKQVRSVKSIRRNRKKARRYNGKKRTPSSRGYQETKTVQVTPLDGLLAETQASLGESTKEDPSLVNPSISVDKNNIINNGVSTESFGVELNEKVDDVALVKLEAEDEASGQPAKDRIIKYERKRKRGCLTLTNSEGNGSSTGKAPLKRRSAEKEKINGSMESQKSALVPESSRDSRRLAQVARQLISLSEKKW